MSLAPGYSTIPLYHLLEVSVAKAPNGVQWQGSYVVCVATSSNTQVELFHCLLVIISPPLQ